MNGKTRKILSLVLSFGLLLQQVSFAQIAAELNISGYLSRLNANLVQDKFRPLELRYFSYDSFNDSFRVIIDKGNVEELDSLKTKEQTKILLSYFLIGVTLPDDKFWVNLRPDSEDQIIDNCLEKTDIGRIMLEADLQLKKDTASFTSPQTPEGREYWGKLYKKAGELYGTENITIPTLTRPWIVPDEIIIRESTDSAYIYKATLKVMLEQDYLKNDSTYSFKDPRLKKLNEYSSQLIRELIIPKLTKEVNSSKRYASLRQIYYSLILARWFKSRFSGKSGSYSSLINTSKLTNLTSQEPWSKSNYFKQYQKSFKDGEYNMQEPVYTPTGQAIRSYFSGGEDLTGKTMAMPTVNNPLTDGSIGVFSSNSTPPAIPGSILMEGKGVDPLSVSSPISTIRLNETDLSAFRMRIHDAVVSSQSIPLDDLISSLPQNSALRNALFSLKQIQGQPTDGDIQRIISENSLNDAEQVGLALAVQPGQVRRGDRLGNGRGRGFLVVYEGKITESGTKLGFFDGMELELYVNSPYRISIFYNMPDKGLPFYVEDTIVSAILLANLEYIQMDVRKMSYSLRITKSVNPGAVALDRNFICINPETIKHIDEGRLAQIITPALKALWQSRYGNSYQPHDAYLNGTLLPVSVLLHQLADIISREPDANVLINAPDGKDYLYYVPYSSVGQGSSVNINDNKLIAFGADVRWAMLRRNNEIILIAANTDVNKSRIDKFTRNGYRSIAFEEPVLKQASSPVADFKDRLSKEIDVLWRSLEEFEKQETDARGYHGNIPSIFDIAETDFKDTILNGLLNVARNESEARIGLKLISDKIVKSPSSLASNLSDHHVGYLYQGSIDTSQAIALAKDSDKLRELINSKLRLTSSLPVTFKEINDVWNRKMQETEAHIKKEPGGQKIFNYALDKLDRRLVKGLIKMFNPGRGGKRPPTAPLDNMEPAFGKEGKDSAKVFCFLTQQESSEEVREEIRQMNPKDVRRMNPAEIIAKNVNYDGVNTDIIVNTNPFYSGHVLFVPERLNKHPQVFIEESARVALAVLRNNNRSSYKITFNSWLAWGSINHLHLQGFDYSDPSGLASLPVEREASELLFPANVGVTVSTLPNWLVRTIVLSSAYKDRDELQKQILKLAKILYAIKQPFNIVFTYNPADETYRVYVFPRAVQGPSKFGTGVAYLELSGEVLFINQDFGGIMLASKDKGSLDQQRERLREVLRVINSKQLYEWYESIDGENFQYYLRPSRSGQEIQMEARDVDDPYMAYAPLTSTQVGNLYNDRETPESLKKSLSVLVNPVYEKKSKEMFENSTEVDLKNEIKTVGVGQDRFDEILAKFNANSVADAGLSARSPDENATVSSPAQSAPKKTGGIDFRILPITIQPMGSFSGLDFKLPQLGQMELKQINIDSEIQQIRNMVQAGIMPSEQRIQELIAACIQKGGINSHANSILLCLVDILKIEEENACESSPELKEALVIVDSRS